MTKGAARYYPAGAYEDPNAPWWDTDDDDTNADDTDTEDEDYNSEDYAP